MTVNNRRLTESMLVAYVDGELDADQAVEVAEALRDDPDAQATVALLRRSATAVREAFDVPQHRPLPDRLLALFDVEGQATGANRPERSRDGDAGGEVVLLPRSRRPLAADWHRALLPVAASFVALLVGFGAGALYRADRSGNEGQQVELAGSPTPGPAASLFEETLYRALETGADGERFAYEQAASGVRGTVTPIGPVATRAGLPCREFHREETGPAGRRSANGLACRGADGGWTVLLAADENGS